MSTNNIPPVRVAYETHDDGEVVRLFASVGGGAHGGRAKQSVCWRFDDSRAEHSATKALQHWAEGMAVSFLGGPGR